MAITTSTGKTRGGRAKARRPPTLDRRVASAYEKKDPASVNPALPTTIDPLGGAEFSQDTAPKIRPRP